MIRGVRGGLSSLWVARALCGLLLAIVAFIIFIVVVVCVAGV